MPAPLNLAGQRFGSLTVLERSGQDRFKAWIWRCRCDCGTVVNVRGSTLRAGSTSACAPCATSRANLTHGQSKTALYRRWQAMKARCTQPRNKHYANYGGRGIRVCDRWMNSFEAFAADMGSTFAEHLELDRIDVEGDYEPGNCRWADRVTQQRNRRNNVVITHGGQTLTVAEWAELTGLKPNTIVSRMRRGWPAERLLELANA